MATRTKATTTATTAAADGVEPDEGPAPTHFLVLACAHSVESSSPCASHHFCTDHEATVPVIHRGEIREES